jgi:hypothetical protein
MPPTVRRGKTRAQKCVNDSCIIPQPHTRGCPTYSKHCNGATIKTPPSSITYMGLKCLNGMDSPFFFLIAWFIGYYFLNLQQFINLKQYEI